MSSEELTKTKSDMAAHYKQALNRAKKNRAAVYPENGVLEGGVKKSPLKEHMKDLLREHSKTYRNYEGLTPMEAAQKWASKFFTHFTGREYYGLASELHDDGKPSKKRLRDNDFYKLDDIHNEETRRLIQSTIMKNLHLDPNDPSSYEKIKDMEIVVPKSTSTLQKQLKNSEVLADYIANNYENLKNNPGQRDFGSTTFNRPSKGRASFHPIKATDEGALFSVLNKANLSSKVNPDGSMDILVHDLYDFDYINPKTQNGFIAKQYANLNNNAYNQQEAGQLQKYGLSIPIHLTKSEVETILNKRANPSAYEKFLRKHGLGLRG